MSRTDAVYTLNILEDGIFLTLARSTSSYPEVFVLILRDLTHICLQLGSISLGWGASLPPSPHLTLYPGVGEAVPRRA